MAEYLENGWYCIGWSSELDEKPVGRTIAGRHVAVFRDSNQAAKAIDGACPHRFAPLALGEVAGDTIRCPYHGLAFDGAGRCVHNPHGDGMIPPNAHLRRYPVAERAGAVWVWLGDPDRADTTRLINRDWLISGDYAVATGYLRVEAHYQLVIDNLLDLSHAPFLHRQTVGGAPEDSIGTQMKHEFKTHADHAVESNYLIEGMRRPTPQMLPLWGDRPGDFRAEMTWHPASTLALDIRMSPVGGDRLEGLHIPSFHFLAPESEGATHYFFAIGRNVMIDDDEQTRVMAQFAQRAFEQEDEPMIRACGQLMRSTDLLSLRPLILSTDVAAVQARRLLAKLIAREKGSHAQAPEPSAGAA